MRIWLSDCNVMFLRKIEKIEGTKNGTKSVKEGKEVVVFGSLTQFWIMNGSKNHSELCTSHKMAKSFRFEPR
jgi:hypothetical protein